MPLSLSFLYPLLLLLAQVGNPELCTKASMLLMEKHGIYVQDINYPTVPRGEEKLRIAPTPHHTDQMKIKFVNALIDVWNELGLEFMEQPVPQPACSRLCGVHSTTPLPIAVGAV